MIIVDVAILQIEKGLFWSIFKNNFLTFWLTHMNKLCKKPLRRVLLFIVRRKMKDFFTKLFWKTFMYFLTNLYLFHCINSPHFLFWPDMIWSFTHIALLFSQNKLPKLLINSISCQNLEFWNMLISPQQPSVFMISENWLQKFHFSNTWIPGNYSEVTVLRPKHSYKYSF